MRPVRMTRERKWFYTVGFISSGNYYVIRLLSSETRKHFRTQNFLSRRKLVPFRFLVFSCVSFRVRLVCFFFFVFFFLFFFVSPKIGL